MEEDMDDFDFSESKSISNGLTDIIGSVEWKIVIVLILICILIFSEVYSNVILQQVPGATDGFVITNKGKMIQSGTVVGGFVIASMLNKVGIL